MNKSLVLRRPASLPKPKHRRLCAFVGSSSKDFNIKSHSEPQHPILLRKSSASAQPEDAAHASTMFPPPMSEVSTANERNIVIEPITSHTHPGQSASIESEADHSSDRCREDPSLPRQTIQDGEKKTPARQMEYDPVGPPKKMPIEELRRRTAAVASDDIPAGSFTPEMWNEARKLFTQWAMVHALANTPESVDQSFALLDRLVLEQEIQGFHGLSCSVLKTKFLQRAVKNWNRCVRDFHKFSLEDQALLRYEYTPMEVLARLENYSDRSPYLQFDTKTLNMILDGASRCSIPGPSKVPGMISPRVATSFAQSLFDRMSADTNRAKAHWARETDLFFDQDGPPAPPPLGQYHNRNRPNHTLPSTRPDYITYSSMIHLFSQNGLASRAEAMLDRMYKQFTISGNPRLRPDVKVFTSVLAAWANSMDPKAAERAEAILKRMNELGALKLMSVQPDEASIVVVLSCWAKSISMSHCNDYKQSCVDRAFNLFSEVDSTGLVTQRMYNAMMAIYNKAGKAVEAEKFLERLKEASANDETGLLKLNSIVYNNAIAAWSNSGSEDCGNRAEALLRDFERQYEAGASLDPPDSYTYNSVMLCLAKANQPERAEQLLRRMKQGKHAAGISIKPDRISYNTVIKAYGLAKQPRKAEELLETMYREFCSMKGNNACMRPDTQSFGHVLHAWLKSGEPNAAERSEAILETMQSLYEANVLDVEPGSIVYNMVLSTWGRSKHPQAHEKAKAILDKMESLYKDDRSSVRPDEKCYDTVIRLHADRLHASQAEEILERLHFQVLPVALGGGGIKSTIPISHSYNRVLGAYRRQGSGSAAERADALWRCWLGRYDAGEANMPPGDMSVQIVLDAWENASMSYKEAGKMAKAFLHDVAKFLSRESPTSLRPEWHNSLVRINAKSEDLESAYVHVVWMCNECLSGRSLAIPENETIQWVISALRSAKSEESAERLTELTEILERMSQANIIEWKPRKTSHRDILCILEGQQTLEAGLRASRILLEMERISQRDNIPILDPGPKDYDKVLNIWSSVNDKSASMLADVVLRKMKSMHEAGDGRFKAKPTHYNAMIKLWKRSDDFFAENYIRKLEEEMGRCINSSPEDDVPK